MITLTDRAVEKLKNFLISEKKEVCGLRLFASGGGCNGYQYGMDVEEAPKEDDQIYEKDGLKIFVDPESRPLLSGAEVDYVEGLNGTGFAIQNPNAKSSCGCGSSFG